jgi:hypothetical protein
MLVRKITVTSVVENVQNDGIIARELRAEPVSILTVKVYMPTSEYEDEEVEELNSVTEEILEEDREIQMNTTIIGDWNTEVGD